MLNIFEGLKSKPISSLFTLLLCFQNLYHPKPGLLKFHPELGLRACSRESWLGTDELLEHTRLATQQPRLATQQRETLQPCC